MSETVTISNAPARIYLNMGEDLPDGEWDFERLHDVTWCADRQGPHDLEYVPAGAVQPLAPTELQRLKRRVTSEFLSASGAVLAGRLLDALHKAFDAIAQGVVGTSDS